jgi:putative transcriptional regulator
MEGMHEVGAIDKQTMREFDEACLTLVQVLAPEEIRQIRQREQISQPLFARNSNVSETRCRTGSAASGSQVALPCAC